jgi:IclR family acetate operon transcriptional repressor
MSNLIPPPSLPKPQPARNVEGKGLSSVDNALRLLQLVGEHQALRVAEVADMLSVARSTAHRLLTALKQRGFLIQDRPNGAYRPGPALNAIGLAAISRIDIRRIARPVLDELRDSTKETITLAVLEGQNVRFIDSVESARSVRVGNRTGVVRLAHSSAVGKAMLAALPAGQLERQYPSEALPEAMPTTITHREHLLSELAEIRRVGYALNWEESSDGICAIAVALCNPAGYPLAGLGVAAPTSRMTSVESMRVFAPHLQDAARRIHELVANER